MTTKKEPTYQVVNGLIYGTLILPDVLREALSYKPKSGDLFIVTYPKCGSNWLQYITYLMYNKGEPPADFLHFLKCTPFLELMGPEPIGEMPGPGGIKTHLPYHILFSSPEAKYIYVTRNPKDCCVSFFHHTRNFIGYDFDDGDFDVFFDLFLDGKVECGGYFDHLLPWYENRDQPNILFLTYEELKKDLRASVLKIARFLGENYRLQLEKDESVINKVLHYSSFEYMHKHFNPALQELYSEMSKSCPEKLPRWMGAIIKASQQSNRKILEGDFVRKGIIGDWKTLFTDDHLKRMNDWVAKKTTGSDVMNLWKDVKEA